MASQTPTNNIIFTEDEDLLDDDDVVGDSDNDSASSAAAAAAAQVTIAVPGVSDLHLPPQQVQEIIVAKKPPAQLDESRKLFQRLWTDEDEIELLQGFLDYNTNRAANGTHHNSSHHHHDTSAFYDQIRSKFQLDFNKNQLVEKLRRLKKKYRNVMNKFGTGKEYVFKSPHDQATFEISSKIWGNTAPIVPNSAVAGVNGSVVAFRPAPIDEEDVDPNNPDCQSPYPNDFDMNSKFPRPRKRNRVGSVKMEDKQVPVHAVNSSMMNNQQAEAVTPVSASITGSISGVIEETVKSCLSPILKELLGNSVSSNANGNANGSSYGQGSSLFLSPIPLGFAGAMSADKLADNRWRKQEILELEVFSKRLDLMQDEIKEKLQELRSMGNN